jgi:hypothetical protein
VWDKVMTQGIHSAIVTYIALARNLLSKIELIANDTMAVGAAGTFYDTDNDMI